ncbi:hypothetical protein OWR29_25470 [Actinoplanes sp. Pm04-4]|uniref:XRE family transcriptional regulator n=1 Tax=Paractinoplanes pyxinae TaxID=2997416 RepID=A0ABT4B4E7_9ACTN|nr:hypothetical protein [Actinoplanes pyxinae]MCY1141362.1 hypothetical protein [Actinoplanes pyxinae]
MTRNTPGMLHIADPTKLGPALGDVRALLGLSRREVARLVAEKTGRTETSVNGQLWKFEAGKAELMPSSLPPFLEVLAVDLALVFREDA